MSNKVISLSVMALLFASCGEHKKSKRPIDPVIPINTATNNPAPQALPNLDMKQYAAVRANFKGSFIGVVDGQLYNFDSEQKAGEPLQFIFANVADASQTILASLDRRPQRIDVVNDDFVLLQRPHYKYVITSPVYKSVEYPQDCFLINIKTGAMWKFDEFFPEFNSFQTVQSGSSKKLLFIGRKKLSDELAQSSGWYTLDLKKDYNYNVGTESGYSMSMPGSSPKVIVSIDFSDSQQVTLRPISSGLDDIANYLADAQGNVLAETLARVSTQSRVLAILQNEQTPVEVSINNANIAGYTYENRIVLDSKQNFWRFSRQSESSGYTVKAERLILARDLDNRPALMPLATLTQTMNNYAFRLDGKAWNGTYKGSELFTFTGLLAMVDAASTTLQLINDPALQSGSMRQTLAAVDHVNGKVVSYLEGYTNSSPSMVIYDVADPAAGKTSIVAPESKAIYGAVKNITSRKEGGFDLETLDGPNANVYFYDSVTGQASLTKSIHMETDNRVRILVPVTAIP